MSLHLQFNPDVSVTLSSSLFLHFAKASNSRDAKCLLLAFEKAANMREPGALTEDLESLFPVPGKNDRYAKIVGLRRGSYSRFYDLDNKVLIISEMGVDEKVRCPADPLIKAFKKSKMHGAKEVVAYIEQERRHRYWDMNPP